MQAIVQACYANAENSPNGLLTNVSKYGIMRVVGGTAGRGGILFYTI